jgi:putative hydrolase of the HAD superfamily
VGARALPERPAGTPLRAITFDFYDTLFADWSPTAMWAATYQRVTAWLRARGVAAEEADVRVAVESGRRGLRAAAVAHAHIGARAVVDVMLDLLHVQLAAAERAELVELLEGSSGKDMPMLPAPGVNEGLRRLAATGVRLGIVSNTGIRPGRIVRRHLAEQGIIGHFTPEAITWSDEVGWMKPDPRIFRTALMALGCQPHEVAHVGDNRVADVGGARGIGIVPVRYRGLRDDLEGPEAELVVDDHRELADALGSRVRLA